MTLDKIPERDLLKELDDLQQQLQETRQALARLQSLGQIENTEGNPLTSSEDRFRTMADGTPVLIWVDDGAGGLEFINRAYCEFFGVALEEIQSTGWHPLLHPDDAENYIREFIQSNQEHRPFRAQARVRRADGNWRWIDSFAQPRFSSSGEFLGMVGSSLDITEAKHTEHALQESEARFRQLADAMPHLVWIASPDGKVNYYNHRRVEYFRFDPEHNENWELMLHPDDLQRTWDEWGKANERGDTYECEHRICMADGSYRWHLSRATPVRDEQGRITRWFGTATDIHATVLASQQLQESETRFRQLADAMPQLVWTSKPDGTRDYYNQRVNEYLGYQHRDDGTWDWTPAWHPDDLQDTLNAWNHALETGEPYESEHRLRMADGSYRWHLSRGVATRDKYGNIIRWYGTGTDIHDRKIAEDELRESELRQRIAKEAAQFGTYELEIPANQIRCDERMLEMWGISPQSPVNLEVLFSAIHPEDQQSMIQALEKAANPNADGAFTIEYRLTHQSDGLERWISTTGLVLKEDSQPVRVIGAIRDITQRKLAEQALRESEKKFSTIFQFAPFPMALTPLDSGVFIDVNQAFLNTLEFELEQVIGKTSLDLRIFPDEAERQRLKDELLQDGFVRDVEITFLTRSGRELILSADSDLVMIEGKPYAIILLENITERRLHEEAIRVYNEQLRRSNQELQDFAYIASHDLQEPLRKVVAFSELIGQKSALDETELDYLARIQDAARRMQKMIDDLLSLSRVSAHQKPFTWVNLNMIAKTIIDDMQAHILIDNGKVILHPLPVIQADALQMHQLIQNLLGNAIKFHRPGVPPLVEIGYKDHSTGKIGIYIRDNGIGFDMRHATEIFQPFKRLHGRSEYEGSGIGLAICQRIVEQHNGRIEADSTPGEGTTFYIVLPVKQIRS